MEIKRYGELDSLRGIASLMVLFSHYIFFFPTSGEVITKKLSFLSPFLFSGHSSVIIFFVLSGFVLSLPFYKENKPKYRDYIIKRICRIYIPYLMIVFVAIGMKLMLNDKLGSIPDVVKWGLWDGKLSFQNVIGHLFFLGEFNSDAFVMVVWSLVHEMRISIIFPLVMLLLLKVDWKISILTAAVLSISSFLLIKQFHTEYNIPVSTNYFITLHYISMFIIGSLVAKFRQRLINFMKTNYKFIFLPIGIAGFYYTGYPFKILTLVTGEITDYTLYQIIFDWIICISGSIIILFALSSSLFSKVLLLKPIHFIGKISYSLYLVHPVVLLSLIYGLYEKMPIIGILTISFFATFFFSYLCYKYIEKPSKTLGRYLTTVRISNTKVNTKTVNYER